MIDLYIEGAVPARPLQLGEAANHEGGIVFAADKWTRLRRFLILGAEGGTYYATARELVAENVRVVQECLSEDWVTAITTIRDVSVGGRAPKNEPAILALAMATVHTDEKARALAFQFVPEVCRTGTHLLHFAAYREALGGGWGRGARRAVGKWFTDKKPSDLAYQAVKYKSRDGWALRDLLRLSHPKMSGAHSAIAKYIVSGATTYFDKDGAVAPWADEKWSKMIQSVLWGIIHTNTEEATVEEIARHTRDYGVPREAVPTEWLNTPEVWDALLADMPATAMLRNLNKMTQVGLISNGSDAEKTVVARLGDAEWLRRARVHPVAVLAALKVYEQGRGERGKLTWTPSKRVVNALDEAFYGCFGTVPATGKRILLALDVSTSMRDTPVNGMPFLSARVAAAAMALVTAAVEPHAGFVAYGHDIVQMDIRPSMRLDEVVREIERIPFGGTICSLPIRRALEHRAEVDAFVSFTDNETFDGSVRGRYWAFGNRLSDEVRDHTGTVNEWLCRYRDATGIPAKHAVVALASNGFTIADPNDAGQLDIVGMDTATPTILSDFIGGVL